MIGDAAVFGDRAGRGGSPTSDSTTNMWEKFTDPNGVKWRGTLNHGSAAWVKMEDAEVKKVQN